MVDPLSAETETRASIVRIGKNGVDPGLPRVAGPPVRMTILALWNAPV